MPSPTGRLAELGAFSREFCRLVVQFERRLRTGTPDLPPPGVVDTPGLGVLVALDAFGPLRPTALATLLAMTTGGTTKVIDRVATRRLVTRRPGTVPGDRRAVPVAITAKGRRAIAAAERHLTAIGGDFVRAIDAVTTPATRTSPPGSPPGAGSALGALYRFFALGDAAVIEAVGDAEVLNPNDPRGILVLLELEHHGALPLAEIPTLIDRSRPAVHQLVRGLRGLGLVAHRLDESDRRKVRLVPTRTGRAMARRIVRSVEAHMPELEPVLVDLAHALRTQRNISDSPHSERSRT